jgi:predicted DNA-binding protein
MVKPRPTFRFSVPLSDELKSLLDELSALSGQPRSDLASDLLESTIPVLRDMLEAFRKIAEAKDDGLQAVRKVVNDYAKQTLGDIYQIGSDFNAEHGSDSKSVAADENQKK